MDDLQLDTRRKSPLANASRSPVNGDTAGITLTIRHDTALAQVFAHNGQSTAVAGLLTISDTPGVATTTNEFCAMPLAKGQWMLSSVDGGDGSFVSTLRSRIGEFGYVSEQSHSRQIISIDGPNARDLLRKGCRLDLSPRIIQPGYCAQTPIAQVGVLLHYVRATPRFDLHVYSGFAESFWHWLVHSAAEFGYRVEG